MAKTTNPCTTEGAIREQQGWRVEPRSTVRTNGPHEGSCGNYRAAPRPFGPRRSIHCGVSPDGPISSHFVSARRSAPASAAATRFARSHEAPPRASRYGGPLDAIGDSTALRRVKAHRVGVSATAHRQRPEIHAPAAQGARLLPCRPRDPLPALRHLPGPDGRLTAYWVGKPSSPPPATLLPPPPPRKRYSRAGCLGEVSQPSVRLQHIVRPDHPSVRF